MCILKKCALYNCVFIDELTITVVPKKIAIGKGKTTQFTAMASGISSNKNDFTYEWKKKGSNNLPIKVSESNRTALTIPNIVEADEGLYYCIVTNEWGRSVESDFVNLTVYGMLRIILKSFVC